MRTVKKTFFISSLTAAIMFSVFVLQGHELFSAGGPGYRGMSLPADFQAFNMRSPWNTLIPDNPEIDPHSKIMIANLKGRAGILKANIINWTVPLFVIDSEASPKNNIRTTSDRLNPSVDPDDNGIAEGIPIPDGVWPDPKTDGHMLLVDPKARRSWDFSRAKRHSDGSWFAGRIDIWDLDGAGWREPFSGKYWWTYGARGSGFPLIAGLIRPEEIEAGEIKHAMVFASPVNRKTSFTGGKEELCSPPASRTDGQGIGNEYLPEGARLQLDPSLDLNSLKLSPAAKIIARAMQKYGMYGGDNAEDFTIYFQNLGPDGGKWKKYNLFKDLENIPVDKFRVIKCNTVSKQ